MILFLAYLIFTLVVLYRAANPIVWEVGSVIYLIAATFFIGLPLIPGIIMWTVIILAAIVLQVEPVRVFLADYFYKTAGKSIPKLSKTEEEALNAGDTWLEQDIFVGKPIGIALLQ